MAEQSDIDNVWELLPPEAKEGDEAWSRERVAAALDSGKSVAGTMAQYWDIRAAQTYMLVNISESGSSRSLSTIHDNAVKMAKYWRDRDKDNEAEEVVGEVRNRVRFHKITRV